MIKFHQTLRTAFGPNSRIVISLLAGLCAVNAQAQSPLAGTLQPSADNPIQKATAVFVEDVCPQLVGAGFGGGSQVGGTDGLRNRCSEIVRAVRGPIVDVDGARDALQAMGAEEDSAVASTEVEAGSDHKTNVKNRLSSLRVAGLNGANSAPSGMAAGEGADGWGFFANAMYGRGDQDATDLQNGFDLDAIGFTLGADKRVTDSTVLGASIGYSDIDTELGSNGGDIDTTGYTAQLYGSYSGETFYFDGSVGYTAHEHDQNRNLNYSVPGLLGGTTVVNQVASSSTDSDELAFSITGGASYSYGSVLWGPYARLDHSRTDIDGFSETMSAPNAAGAGLAVSIDSQDIKSTTLALGLQASGQFDGGGDAIFYPQFSVEYVHEFDNDNDDITGRFVDDVTRTTFRLPTDAPDRNYANVGVGLVGDFGDGISANIAYQGLFGYSDLSLHAVQAGVRIDF